MPSHLYELLVERVARFPDQPALGAQQGLGWRTVTGAELLQAVDGLAAELAALGVAEGDRVVLWLPGHWRTPAYFFALWKLGAIAVPFDREMNPQAGAHIIESVQPRLVLAGYDERPVWAAGVEVTRWWEPGSRPEKQRPQPERSGAVPPNAGSPSLSSFPIAGERAPQPRWQRPAEELAAIFFTSGTTGSPKGCMITHANLCYEVEALQYTVPLDISSRLASVLPLSHLFELTVGLLYPLSRGSAIHYVPSRRGPDILRVLNEQHITHIIAVPQLLALMGAALDERLRAMLPGPLYRAAHGLAPRLPMAGRRLLFWPVHRRLGGHLRMMASGGAPLPEDVQRLWERMGVRVLEGYGTSECSPVVACAVADGTTPPGTVGRPLRGVEVRLSDENELLVRGPNVMRGYWQDPERTAEVLRDGWYATGDMASIDAQGNIRILGRVKDLIVLPSGLKVWPQDVEEVFRDQPGVKDAAVTPVPTSTGGAGLHAYLLPAAAPGDLQAIVASANARLAVHQRVATASWWPEADFPRTSTLKVRRNLLPVPELATTVRVAAAVAADDPVGMAIAGVARAERVRPEQTLAELGLDSLGLVELTIALEEKTGRSVPDDALRLESTVAEIRQLLAAETAAERGGSAREWRRATPVWPYTWGRVFRVLSAPVDLLYRKAVTRTVVLGGEHLEALPRRVILAGTHHGFADMPLIRHGLAQTPARRLASRLLVAAGAGGFARAGLLGWYGILAFGLYPLQQHREQEESLRRLLRLAEAGNAILIFPQGTHSTPAEEQASDPRVRFRTGVAHLALSLEATVVPFGLAGTEKVMPTTVEGFHGLVLGGIPLSFTPGPLAIAFGSPLTPEPGETPEAFTARLQQASLALTRQAEKAIG